MGKSPKTLAVKKRHRPFRLPAPTPPPQAPHLPARRRTEHADEVVVAAAAGDAAAPSAKASAAAEDHLDEHQYFEYRSRKVADLKVAGQSPYPHKFHVSTSLQGLIKKVG